MVPSNPQTKAEIVASLRQTKFMKTDRYHEQQVRAHREGAHPDILEFDRRFVKEMAALGVPVFAAEIWRSAKRQDELYKLGNSKAKGGQSPHQAGMAVDMIHSIKGWDMTEDQWGLFEHVGKEVIARAGLDIVSLAWGGDWNFYDPAHWEINSWKKVLEWQSKATR